MASPIQAELNLRTICNALGSIEHKWYKIGVQLGIPRNKLQAFKKEEDPLSAVTDYWLSGNVTESVVPISWESIVSILKSEYLGEQGLAEKIQSKYCFSQDTQVEEDADLSSHEQLSADKIDPDVRMDLEFILERNLKQILKRYASFVDHVRAAICEKGVSPEDLRVYLLTLPATSKSCEGQMLNLLSDKKQELENCTTIAEIFSFLTTECASFLNYDIFQSILDHYKVKADEKEYDEDLEAYINKHKISEFVKINPLLKNKKGSKELTLKYDISMISRLGKVCQLKKIVAEIMDLSPSTLKIVDIEEGCVIVTFLIPASVADTLFTPDTVFTPQQEEKLRANSVIWIRCDSYTLYNTEKQDPAIQKLKDQLTCPVCLGTYTDPKQLQCQHAYCQQCLMGLVQQDQQGQPTLTCPTCRQVTPVPAGGVAGLQADFRTNQLLEIVDKDWRKEATEQAALVPPSKMDTRLTFPTHKVTFSCPEHDGKDMELFCETCEETICFKCAVKGGKHYSHDYMDLSEALDKYKSKIQASLVTIEKALEKLDVHRDLISNWRATIEEEIHSTITDDDQKTEVISQFHQLTQAKIKCLAAQRDQLETTQAQLHKHLHHMREESSKELTVRRMSSMVKQVNQLISSLTQEGLEPNTDADLKFSVIDIDTGKTCRIILLPIVKKDIAFGESASLILETINLDSKKSVASAQFIKSFLTNEKTSEITDCSIAVIETNVLKISYQPTIPGTHQLHIIVQNQHITGSPFLVTAKPPVWTEFVKVPSPRDIAVNKKKEVIVTSSKTYCTTVFSPNGEKLLSFGTFGSDQGQFQCPQGVAVDEEGNIFVADYTNNSIQKFTAGGEILAAVGNEGSRQFQINYPRGIALNASNDKVYVTDEWNNQTHILNSDLSYAGVFGRLGSNRGEFSKPWHIACDNTGNVYVVDRNNHRVQVFTGEGQFLRMFGKHGKGDGELSQPRGIAIQDDKNRIYISELGNHRVSVFTLEGKFMFSTGAEHFKEPGGIAVSSDGRVYMCDSCEKVFCASC